jgi:hypothetical protein
MQWFHLGFTGALGLLVTLLGVLFRRELARQAEARAQQEKARQLELQPLRDRVEQLATECERLRKAQAGALSRDLFDRLEDARRELERERSGRERRLEEQLDRLVRQLGG